MTTIQRESCHRDIITLDNVSFSYQKKDILKNMSFSVKERDFIGLIGTNGAGKTTTLRLIVGLLKPTSGKISLFGEPIDSFKAWEKIGYVPQKNHLNPLFPATVKEVVLSGLKRKNNWFGRTTKDDLEKCHDALMAMGVEDLAEKRIGELSGGQQQRVFLARALINNPSLLILDEPTIGIDVQTQKSFFHMIKHMHQHHNITFLMVSHDMDMIKGYLGDEPADQIGKLNFYIRHSHDTQQCVETNLVHSLRHLRKNFALQSEGTN